MVSAVRTRKLHDIKNKMAVGNFSGGHFWRVYSFVSMGTSCANASASCA